MPAETLLPGWWPLAVLAPVIIVLLVGILRSQPPTHGPSPGRTTTLGTLPQRPVIFGLVAFLGGAVGVLFTDVTFVERLIVVAPIFEELGKFGLALLLVGLLRLSDAASGYAAGVLSGLGFGVLEHHVTYAGEADLSYILRVVFHASAAALSLTIYLAHRRQAPDRPMLGWLALVPAILVHAANNLFALLTAVASINPGVPVGFGLALMLVLAAIVTVVRPDDVLGALARLAPGKQDATQETPAWQRVSASNRPETGPTRRCPRCRAPLSPSADRCQTCNAWVPPGRSSGQATERWEPVEDDEPER